MRSPNGADVDLMHAIHIGDVSAVRRQLEKGGDPNVCDDGGMSTVHHAIDRGSLDTMKTILNTCKKFRLTVNLDAVSKHGENPLSMAVRVNNYRLVELLLEEGANPNAVLRFGRSALHLAVTNGRVNIARLLLRYNADPNVFDDFDQSPLGLALLSEHGPVLTKHLLTAGADPDLRMRSTGVPLLSYAALATSKAGDLRNVKALLRAGADINARDTFKGETVLHCAAKSGYIPLIELLICEGADLTARNKVGETPFLTAFKFRNEDCARHLDRLERMMIDEEFDKLDMREYVCNSVVQRDKPSSSYQVYDD